MYPCIDESVGTLCQNGPGNRLYLSPVVQQVPAVPSAPPSDSHPGGPAPLQGFQPHPEHTAPYKVSLEGERECEVIKLIYPPVHEDREQAIRTNTNPLLMIYIVYSAMGAINCISQCYIHVAICMKI